MEGLQSAGGVHLVLSITTSLDADSPETVRFSTEVVAAYLAA
jgi:hypothetical protein